MADSNGPVFTTGFAPSPAVPSRSPRHAHVSNARTGQYRARQFIRAARERRNWRPRWQPLERVAWYCAGLVTGSALAVIIIAGTATLNGCSW